MPTGWRWDPGVPGYVTPDGRRQPLALLRPAADMRAEESRARLQRLAGELIGRQLSVGAFEAAVRDEIRMLHIELRLMAIGGREHATPRDWGRVGAALRDEYGYLRSMCARIRRGELSEARIRSRTVQYAGANALEEFENGRMLAMRGAGCAEKRRVLRPAAHCPTCVEEAEQGWVPIDQPGWIVGDGECGPACRCTMEYRGKEG